MRKVLPVIAGALLTGAVGLLTSEPRSKRGKKAKKARSPKAKRAAASVQHRGPRLSVRKKPSKSKATKRA
jgi:hypothetical protein